MSTRTVFGITRTHAEAQSLVEALTAENFDREKISVLFPSEAKREALRLDTETPHPDVVQTETNAPEGAAVGAGAGSALFGALGLLVSLGALAVPGIGPFLAAGPILVTLGGVGVGAAVGGLAGGFVGYGIPEHHARRFETLVQDGAILVAAHCESSQDQLHATQVFARAGVTDIVSSVAPSKERTGASGMPGRERKIAPTASPPSRR